MPPQVRNETLAQLLADLARVTHEEANRNPYCGLLAMKVSMLISDFLDERSENLVDLYTAKLHLGHPPKFKVELDKSSATCTFENEVGNEITLGVATDGDRLAVTAMGPDSTVYHKWTAVEASLLAELIQYVQRRG